MARHKATFRNAQDQCSTGTTRIFANSASLKVLRSKARYSCHSLNEKINPLEAAKIKDIMENAVDLEIPNKVDYESGKNWGEIK